VLVHGHSLLDNSNIIIISLIKMHRNSGSGRNSRPNNGGRGRGDGGRGVGRGRGGRGLPTASARGRVSAAAMQPMPPLRTVNPGAALNALATAEPTPRGAATADQSVLDALEEEEQFDLQNREEFPGIVDDSEDEDEDTLEADHIDRMEHEDENLAAIREDELIESSTSTAGRRRFLSGSPPGWKPPSAPDNWTPSEIDPKTKQPEWEDVDNPGDWSQFVYRPKFKVFNDKKKPKEYRYHAMPAGATPVPINDKTGERTLGDWHFFYKGWNRDEVEEEGDHLHGLPIFRSGATRHNMFPASRKGALNADTLRKLGLDTDRMKDKEGFPDALFFYQLLLPIGDTSKNGDDDPRMSFYSDVACFSNSYATAELKLGSGYYHNFKNVQVPELVRWDGVVVQDGVRGGSDGAIVRRFNKTKYNTGYDKLISSAFTKTRWLEIKRVVKLCNNLTAPKKKEPNYDPCYKFDLIFKCIIHNTNALTKRTGLDGCGDETSFGHQGFGEPDSGVISLIIGKPGICRGGQIVLYSDVDRMRPRAYLPRHKLHDYAYTQKGPSEVRMIYEQLELLMKPVESDVVRFRRPIIMNSKPHITWDNFFSGDDILHYAAEKGFGLTMTSRRDRLPGCSGGGIPSKYWHKEKTNHLARAKAARYEQPIFAIKRVGKDSLIQHMSMQSTSSCNISSVNALNELSLYVGCKERGRGQSKRSWGIEMNESRQLYLNTYGIIDQIDHYIKNCNMSYR
jgi:hypothetical protein